MSPALGDFDVAIVGSGFAGSLLARLLARRGLAVALVERGQHPRFALGESSTPLAALALERLARRQWTSATASFGLAATSSRFSSCSLLR